MDSQMALFEELSLNSHPALQTQFYDGWILRFSNGYTNRANSVNMIYESTIDIETKIDECERRYWGNNLPCVFKILDGNADILDGVLSTRGYSVVTPTSLMSMELKDVSFDKSDSIIKDKVDEEWFDTYIRLSNYTDSVKIDTMKQMIRLVKNKAIYCLVKDGDRNVACASAVIERGYMALLNVVVDKELRGNGFGKKLCQSIIAAAKEAGAHTAYLQVVDDNIVAVNLYKQLGYKICYSYWYRVHNQNKNKTK